MQCFVEFIAGFLSFLFYLVICLWLRWRFTRGNLASKELCVHSTTKSMSSFARLLIFYHNYVSFLLTYDFKRASALAKHMGHRFFVTFEGEIDTYVIPSRKRR